MKIIMKKVILGVAVWILMLVMFQPVQAQDEAQAQQQIDIRQTMVYRMQKGIYQRAVKYSDVNTAINALYNICVLEPQNDSILYALAYIYFDNQRYFSATLTLNDVLLLNPNNEQALEMRAVSLEQVGAIDKSLEDYESLYLRENNINFLYKMAILQYQLKRYKESKTNIDIMLTKSESDEIKIYFPDENDIDQEVVLRASLHNLKGLIAKDEGDTVEARKQFGIALEVQSDFYLAKKNYEGLSN
jgi:tetratricopeptide (TPR) repeat protein